MLTFSIKFLFRNKRGTVTKLIAPKPYQNQCICPYCCTHCVVAPENSKFSHIKTRPNFRHSAEWKTFHLALGIVYIFQISYIAKWEPLLSILPFWFPCVIKNVLGLRGQKDLVSAYTQIQTASSEENVNIWCCQRINKRKRNKSPEGNFLFFSHRLDIFRGQNLFLEGHNFGPPVPMCMLYTAKPSFGLTHLLGYKSRCIPQSNPQIVRNN